MARRSSYSRGRGGNDKIRSERDLRLDGVGDKALGLDAFHDFAGAFELGLVFEADAGPNRDLLDLVLAFNVLKQTFGAPFISRRSEAVGETSVGWGSVGKVSIMQVWREATSSSSGDQKLGSPLNSGGLPTTTSAFAGAESVARRPELQVVFAL